MEAVKKPALLLTGIFNALLVEGCDMTRSEVIAAKKECEDAGMEPVILINGLTMEPHAVRCDVAGN